MVGSILLIHTYIPKSHKFKGSVHTEGQLRSTLVATQKIYEPRNACFTHSQWNNKNDLSVKLQYIFICITSRNYELIFRADIRYRIQSYRGRGSSEANDGLLCRKKGVYIDQVVIVKHIAINNFLPQLVSITSSGFCAIEFLISGEFKFK